MVKKDPQLREDAARLLTHTWFINMRAKNQDKKKVQLNQGVGSLQTIIEKQSETDTASKFQLQSQGFIQVVSAHNVPPNSTERNLILLENYEPDDEHLNLANRLGQMNFQTKKMIPSKQKHIFHSPQNQSMEEDPVQPIHVSTYQFRQLPISR